MLAEGTPGAIVRSQDSAWRPLAYVSLQEDELRGRVAEQLRSEGWTVVAVLSGYHLVQCLAAPLLGGEAWVKPQLVVVDAYSPGCSGVTVARGLRDLNWQAVSVVVLANPEQRESLAFDGEDGIYLADEEQLSSLIGSLTRRRGGRLSRTRCRRVRRQQGRLAHDRSGKADSQERARREVTEPLD